MKAPPPRVFLVLFLSPARFEMQLPSPPLRVCLMVVLLLCYWGCLLPRALLSTLMKYSGDEKYCTDDHFGVYLLPTSQKCACCGAHATWWTEIIYIFFLCFHFFFLRSRLFGLYTTTEFVCVCVCVFFFFCVFAKLLAHEDKKYTVQSLRLCAVPPNTVGHR